MNQWNSEAESNSSEQIQEQADKSREGTPSIPEENYHASEPAQLNNKTSDKRRTLTERKKKRWLFVILLCSAVIILTSLTALAYSYTTRSTWNSYSGFGFAFRYPEAMKPKVAKECTVQRGSIEAKEEGKVVHLRWMQGVSGEEAITKEVLGPYLRSRAQGQKINFQFFIGESKWIKTQDQRRLFARFYTTDKKHVLLNVAYAWYSEKSERTFILCCGAPWDDPVILFNGTHYKPDWPEFHEDPSYSLCQDVLRSFEDKPTERLLDSERDDAAKTLTTAMGKKLNSFDKFAISFKYPTAMEVIRINGRKSNTKPSSQGGDLLAQNKQGQLLRVIWSQRKIKVGDVASVQSVIKQALSAFTDWISLSAKEQGCQIYTETSSPRTDRFGHSVQWFRFLAHREDSLAVASAGVWWCSNSERVFLVVARDTYERPLFFPEDADVNSPIGSDNWLALEKDPSYKVFHTVMSSFACCGSTEESSKLLSRDSTGTGNEKWVKLVSLAGDKEMKLSDPFSLKVGEIKICLTLSGETVVQGELNKTIIGLFRTDLTMDEAFRKGREGADISVERVASGRGPSELTENVEPGIYTLYGKSEAGAHWTLEVYEKRKGLKELGRAVDHHNRGVAHAKKGQYELAISEFNNAIKINPEYAGAYVSRGSIYGAKGLYDRAISDLNNAIEIDPNYAAAYNNRGNVYLYKRQYNQAISDFTKAIEIDPGDDMAYNNRGTTYDSKGKYDLAISDYTKAIEINPRSTGAYNNRGLTYDSKGEYDLAISDFTMALKINPRLAVAYKNRGVTYYNKGEYDKAWDDVHKAQSLGGQVRSRFLKALREASGRER